MCSAEEGSLIWVLIPVTMMRIRKRQPGSPTIYNSSTRRKHSILLFSNDPPSSIWATWTS